jgi:hypothetical protein
LIPILSVIDSFVRSCLLGVGGFGGLGRPDGQREHQAEGKYDQWVVVEVCEEEHCLVPVQNGSHHTEGVEDAEGDEPGEAVEEEGIGEPGRQGQGPLVAPLGDLDEDGPEEED